MNSTMKIGLVVAALAISALNPANTQGQGGGGGGKRIFLPGVNGGAGPDLANQVVLRVTVNNAADVEKLVNGGWDLVEGRGPDYLLVVGDAAVKSALEAQGFSVTIDPVQTKLDVTDLDDDLVSAQTYYGGYRTVAEHYAHLDSVVATYPALTKLYDYGDSWRKVNGVANGHDLKVICITANAANGCALNPNSAKPRFFIMASIHARELSTAETAWRWIDYLTQGYNTDAEVTTILDHNEMWIVPVFNPDGRTIVESGGNSPYLQRKNANTSAGACSNPPTSSNQFGVDLNRNAGFKWGGVGTSTNPCDQTYRGIAAASEPEEQAFESLVTTLFPDQRGPADGDVAPDSTVGTLISLHSYSNFVLLPWGFAPAGTTAPNDAGLRALAFRMSYFNNYVTGTGPEILYATTGTSDDWSYGTLGIASFTFELGPTSGACSGFTPAYSCQDGTFWPLNRPALLYAAKTARQPYALSKGPSAASVSLSAGTVAQNGSVVLSASIDDNQSGNAAGSVNRPPAQAVSAAESYIDTPPWAGGTPIAMSASDGTFNASVEGASATINGSGLSLGRHTLYVRGRDALNNWGPVTAVFLNVSTTVNSQSLVPTADAQVRAGSSANTNYGTLTTMLVRNASSANNTRWSYVKFDTSSVSGSIASAKVRLFAVNSSSASITVQCFGVANTTWSETGLTWNNKPASGSTALASLNAASTTAAFYEFDVTAYVNAERAAGRNVISLAFKGGNITSNTFNINTKENATNPIRLVVTQ